MYNYEFEANPPPDSHIWTRDGEPLSSGGRIALSTNINTSSLTIVDVNRNDAGVYRIFSSNAAGNGSALFTLSVYCEFLRVYYFNSVYMVRYIRSCVSLESYHM